MEREKERTDKSQSRNPAFCFRSSSPNVDTSNSQNAMILGVGIDILHLARFESLLLRRGPLRLAKRICTPRELSDFHSTANAARFLSSR